MLRNRDRAAKRYGEYAFLKARESSALAERLGDVSRRFPNALDIGSHNGEAARRLLATEQVDSVMSLDPSPKFSARVPEPGETLQQSPLERLDVEAASLDLITSVLSLHWVNDLPGLLVQIRQALKQDGLFLACLFGGGTLTELRAALSEAEIELSGGASARLSPLPGLQDMAGLLQRTGFAMPVVDLDHITVRYDHPLKLMQDLRGMGEQAAFAQTGRKPLSRRILHRASEIYAERYADPDGRIPASFEIIWLSGWAPSADQPKPLRPGSAKSSLEAAVQNARKP